MCKERIVTFETAQLAKEAGFNVPVENTYEIYPDGATDLQKRYYKLALNTYKDICNAPTQSVLHQWTRENYGLHIIAIPTVTSAWTFKSVTVLSKRDDDVILGIKSVSDLPPYEKVNGSDYSTYEDALEAGLQEILQLIIDDK